MCWKNDPVMRYFQLRIVGLLEKDIFVFLYFYICKIRVFVKMNIRHTMIELMEMLWKVDQV